MKIKPNLVLYIAAGVFFFIFWMMVVFPRDALESRILNEIENQSGGRYRVEMKDMDLSLLGSVEFEKLKVLERVGSKDEVLLDTPMFELGFSPLGILSKKTDFSFAMEGNKKGDLEGDFRQKNGETELNVEFDEFPIEDLKFLASKVQLDIRGDLEGVVRFNVNSESPNENKGKIDLNLNGLRLEKGRIRLDPKDPASAMDLPQVQITGKSGSHIKATLNRDKLEVQSIALTGGDLVLRLKGQIILRGNNPQAYRLALEGELQVGKKLSDILPLSYLKLKKNAQGAYPLALKGPLAKPQIWSGKTRLL